jgi:hypothetical protein
MERPTPLRGNQTAQPIRASDAWLESIGFFHVPPTCSVHIDGRGHSGRGGTVQRLSALKVLRQIGTPFSWLRVVPDIRESSGRSPFLGPLPIESFRVPIQRATRRR